MLLWALLEATIKGQTPSNQEVTVETTTKRLPAIVSIRMYLNQTESKIKCRSG